MTNPPAPLLFDRALVRRHIARARPQFSKHSDLFDDVAAQLGERLSEITHPFHEALDLSPFPFLAQRKENAFRVTTPDEMPDDEALPYAPQSFDLIVSNLGLHWANDLPKVLERCRAILKPEGLFLAALIGGHSLHELRECLLEAEVSVSKGASPRLSPMIDVKTAGDLILRAGYSLPVADNDTVTLLYTDAFALMRDLRGMGQTNALVERLRHPTRRAVFEKTNELYLKRYGNADGQIVATFDILYMHGWK